MGVVWADTGTYRRPQRDWCPPHGIARQLFVVRSNVRSVRPIPAVPFDQDAER